MPTTPQPPRKGHPGKPASRGDDADAKDSPAGQPHSYGQSAPMPDTGEPPIEGATIDALAASIRTSVRSPVDIVRNLEALPAAVAALSQRGDLVLTLGAGSIGTVGDRILDALREKGSRA